MRKMKVSKRNIDWKEKKKDRKQNGRRDKGREKNGRREKKGENRMKGEREREKIQ